MSMKPVNDPVGDYGAIALLLYLLVAVFVWSIKEPVASVMAAGFLGLLLFAVYETGRRP